MSDIVWQATPSRLQNCAMNRFMHFVNEKYNYTGQDTLRDYAALHVWSVQNKPEFWSSLAEFAAVRFSEPWQSVLEDTVAFPHYDWFRGSRLNFAENLLRHADQHKQKPALVFWGEDQVRRALSYGELQSHVARLATALRAMGVQSGDRVAAYMPNTPETVVAMLAAVSIGAVWSSCSPDFGLHAVVDRFGQIEPVVLFACDGYFFKGKVIDKLTTLRQLHGQLPKLQRMIIVPYTEAQPDISDLPNAQLYQDVLDSNEAVEIDYQQLPFDHPIYILYSSGTTGKPKCIVHGAGGTLLQHIKELMLHCDIGEQDRVFYFTTCGWMMWNWLVSNLSLGATLMLYDGAPLYPRSDYLFEYAAKERFSVFGTSAKYLSALQKELQSAQLSSLRNRYDLEQLRLMLSTGSPLAPESFDYVYADIKPDVQLASISGGTDIISCFALGNPMLPVYRGELQSPGLGMDVRILNEDGQEVTQQKGELCCKPPFPSMPVAFWNDADGALYKAAYFERFVGYWSHGDYAEISATGGLIIYGRSDAVLNPGGVRIGTAEIYRQVEKLPQILESIAVAQEWDNDVRIVLFVKLNDQVELDDTLCDSIRQVIRDNTTPRHVPTKIIQVPDIPRTISGKIVELAVSNIIHNRPVKNRDALANPEALEAFKDLDALKS